MENVNKRAKAFNEREIEVMTDYIKLNIHKLRMNHGSGGPGMVARVREIWDELLAGVNACGNGPRTLQQIKEKWRNMTKNAKADVSKQRNHAAATGGGPPLTEMSQTSQAVASLFTHSASFHGVADTVIAVTPPSPGFLGLPIMELLTAMDIPDPFGVAETFQDNTPRCPRSKENSSATSVPSTSTSTPLSSDSSRKRTLKDAQLEALESQAEMSREGAACYRKVTRLAELLIERLEKQ